jgi:hypothetical protein
MFPIFLNYKKTLREAHNQDPGSRTNPIARPFQTPIRPENQEFFSG